MWISQSWLAEGSTFMGPIYSIKRSIHSRYQAGTTGFGFRRVLVRPTRGQRHGTLAQSGQSVGLITRWSMVQIHQVPLHHGGRRRAWHGNRFGPLCLVDGLDRPRKEIPYPARQPAQKTLAAGARVRVELVLRLRGCHPSPSKLGRRRILLPSHSGGTSRGPSLGL